MPARQLGGLAATATLLVTLGCGVDAGETNTDAAHADAGRGSDAGAARPTPMDAGRMGGPTDGGPTDASTRDASVDAAVVPSVLLRVNGLSGDRVEVTGPGATVEITWNAVGVEGCRARSVPSLDGWGPGEVGTSGSTAALPIRRDTVLSLHCDELPPTRVSIQHSLRCEDIPLPPRLLRAPSRITYTELNDDRPFGTSVTTNAIADFHVQQYLEVSDLRTSEREFRRKLQFFPTPSNLNSPYVITMSISECPGDFTENAVCTRSLVVTTFPQVSISTWPEDDPATHCVIEPDSSYYLNVVHDQFPFDDEDGRCGFEDRTRCAVFFNELNAL